MDHLVPAMVILAAGGDPLKLKYIPYDAGGKAMAGLLSGDTQVLSTGFGEALGLANQGEVRILAVTSDERLSQAPDVPTVKELGYDVTFANWRGFFGIPGLSKDKAAAYSSLLKKMYDTPEWEDIRKQRGWQNLYHAGDDFYAFLEGQEKSIGDIMRKLGFLQ
jgi:putative tricarboxylic transport membrane protein